MEAGRGVTHTAGPSRPRRMETGIASRRGRSREITVVIPAHNEERTAGRVIREVRAELPNAKIIVVDDGSTDGTHEACRREGAEIIRHGKRLGLGPSIREGLEQAKETAVIIDADGEYSPKDIGRLLTKLETCDLALGSRFIGKKPEMKIAHKIGNLLFSGLVSAAIGQKITDAQTGLRALNRKALPKIKLSGGYTYTQEMIILAAKNGLKIGEVGAAYHTRTYGESKIAKNPFIYGVKVLPQVIRTALRTGRTH